MNTYITLDLEWNQSPEGKSGSVPGLPFEIIEIGAVKLDRDFHKLGEFQKIIRPAVYRKLHFRVHEIVNIGIEELKKNGEDFCDVCREFLDWCYNYDAEGVPQDKPIFCTWGESDLNQLRRNMAYFKVADPFPYPFLYYDVQKLYAILTEGDKKKVSPLDKAVESLGIEICGEFHRALKDADYTAKVLQHIDISSVRDYLSMDYYRIPQNESEEIYLLFPDYSKFVSREYPGREEAMNSPHVAAIPCFVCGRMLRKKIYWFSSNQKQYHCIARCPEHGLMKGKIRIKKAPDGGCFIVKTIKPTTPEKARAVGLKKEELKQNRK